jgi:hypothetical protein
VNACAYAYAYACDCDCDCDCVQRLNNAKQSTGVGVGVGAGVGAGAGASGASGGSGASPFREEGDWSWVIPDWLMSPLDTSYHDHNHNHNHNHDGFPHEDDDADEDSGVTQWREDDNEFFVGDTTPCASSPLHIVEPHIHPFSTSTAMSHRARAPCAIAVYAEGRTHLLQALSHAAKAKMFLSNQSATVCRHTTPILVLYTHQLETVIMRVTGGDALLERLLATFDTIYEVPSVYQGQGHMAIPSNTTLHRALLQTQQAAFHHSPSLWMRRLVSRLHAPAELVMWTDTDLVPCRPGFDIR